MSLPAYAMNRASFPEAYERWLVAPLFRPWAELLVARLGLAPGESVLDVACGTGIVARVAKERLGEQARVVGVDLSPQMLAVARAVAPGIDWREGTAAALPVLDSERFDVVACHQGLQFFPDKPAAADEMRRALVPGGRLAIATWRPLEEMPLLRELHRVAERHLGAIVDQRHSYGDPAVLEALLIDAGFRDVRIEVVSQDIRFSDGSAFLRLNTLALVGMSAGSKELGDEERGRIAATIESDGAAVLSPYTDREGLRFTLSANVVTARA